MDTFLAGFEDEEDLYFEFIGKATMLFADEDYILFKTQSKKRARKVRRGSSSSVEIILTNKGIKEVLDELPILLQYTYLVAIDKGILLRVPQSLFVPQSGQGSTQAFFFTIF